MKKTILGIILTLSTLGLVSIGYNNAPSSIIPPKQTNTPTLSYPTSLTEITISPELLDELNQGSNTASYRPIPKLPKPKLRTYQLINQQKIDHLLTNIDKSTFQTKYMKKGVYYLVDKVNQRPLLRINIGYTVNTLDNTCTISKDTFKWRDNLDVNLLSSCTHQWLLSKKSIPYPTLLKEFTDLLNISNLSQSNNISTKLQCQEMVYTFGEYISEQYPLKEILNTPSNNLCSNNQYLLRSIYSTAAHDSKGLPSDFDLILNSCLQSQRKDNSEPVVLSNCKSALGRAIAYYYFTNPTKAISICNSVPTLRQVQATDQCPSLIYNEYFSQLRSLSSKTMNNSTNKTLLKHMLYFHQLTPEKICIEDNLSGCWEASMLFIDKNYEQSIPKYLQSCALIPHSNQSTCELGIYYLLGKLYQQFSPEQIQLFCSQTSSPENCLNRVKTINKQINRENLNTDL